MKLTRKQIKKIIKEEMGKIAQLEEGMQKRIYGEFENFVMEYELGREDIEGMLDILFPPKEKIGQRAVGPFEETKVRK